MKNHVKEYFQIHQFKKKYFLTKLFHLVQKDEKDFFFDFVIRKFVHDFYRYFCAAGLSILSSGETLSLNDRIQD